ncbi:hypothetical protein KR044_003907, partial [Drosophila immigrans]
MQSCSGCGLKLLVLCLLLGLVMQGSCARVIYYKDQNSNQTSATNGTNSSLEKGMLFAVNRTHCRHGYMHDHRNRCRRVS